MTATISPLSGRGPAGSPHESRVLILAPTGNDARLTAEFLNESGIATTICADGAGLCRRIDEGCAALILAEEALDNGAATELVQTLARQPEWSDIPISIITSGGEVSRARLRRLALLDPGGNVTVLERPFRPQTLVSTIEVALKARQRQREVRDLLASLRASEERMRRILGTISDAFIALDPDWRITYVNPAYMKLVAPLYRSADELLGHDLWDRFPDIVGTEVGRFYEQAMAGQRAGTFEVFYDPLKAWLEIRASPSSQALSLYVRDISERKKHEAEVAALTERVQEQARIFDTTLSNISDFAYTLDRQGRFIYANKPLLDLWGRSLEECVGKSFFDLPYPHDLAAHLDRQIAEVVETGATVRDETAYTNPAGETGYYEYIFSPVFDAGGRVEIVAGSTRVTTERKRREAEVVALTRKIGAQATLFDATLANIADLVYSFDREARVIFANKALLAVWDKTLPEVVGRNLFELGYPDELARKLHGQLLSVIATGRAVHDETIFHNAAGVADIHDYIFNPVFDEHGVPTAVVGTTRLVTEHRRAEGAMRQLAAIVQSSDDAIISKDLDGIIMSWNVGAERLFGYTAEEIVGRSVLILIPPERQKEEPEIVGRIARGEPVQFYETVRLHKDGRPVTVSLSISPIKDRTGNIVGASKIVRDISEQKKAEAALKEAKDVAEAANRSKDHFLAVLSHELRTPLTPVLMAASALEMSPTLPPALRADMAMIRRNVELETKLIDDLLDLSRITTGKLSLRVQPVELNDAVREVGAICQAQIQEKGVRLHLDLLPDKVWVRADPARLQQMLWNVLKNAAKFAPAEGGEIQVTIRRTDGRLAVEIRDNGIGIAPEILPRVFDAFEQGNAQITRQFGGLGLGLAITKALAELHEGAISAASDGLGQGSTFVIELPETSAVGMEPRPPGESPREGDSLRILMVEDHADTAMMLARLLGLSGYAVTVANSVAQALAEAERQSFDLVVSDIGLPDATGYELMRGLRQRDGRLRGIAMSGYGMEEDIRRSFAAGFDEHLVKPVDVASLEAAIRRLARAK